MTEIVEQVAKLLPDHQTNRGNEFREIPVDERLPMARAALVARCQVKSSNANWEDGQFRYHMREKKEKYLYEAGRLGVDIAEAKSIWWSYVYEGPSPAEKNMKNLI